MSRRLGPALAAALAAAVLAAVLAPAAWWLARPPETRPLNPRAPLAPGKRYVVRLWTYRWPPAPGGQAYEDWMASALAAFAARHPNIRVEHRVLDWDTGEQELQNALRDGAPPDVYGTLPGAAALYSRELQVPADPYLERPSRRSPGELSRYLPQAWEAATVAGRPWAWPWYLAAHVWVANRTALARTGTDPDRIARLGWSRPEAGDALSRLTPGTLGLTLNPASPAVLEDLLAAAGIPAALDPEGTHLWSRPAVSEAAGWLEALRTGGLLPAASQADAMVDQIMHGRSALLGGVRPWLAARLAAVPGSERSLVFVPAPGAPGAVPGMRLSAALLVVFRPRHGTADDQVRAAVELARFLSRAGHPWVRPDSPLMPAYVPAWRQWAAATRSPAARALPGYAFVRGHAAPGRPWSVSLAERRWLGSAAAPALAEFWAGKADAGALARRLGVEPPAARPQAPWWRRLLDRLTFRDAGGGD